MPDKILKYILNIMSEKMADKISNGIPDLISNRMPDRLIDRISKQINDISYFGDEKIYIN